MIDANKPHHRLLKGVPFADFRPPEKIKTTALEEVHLSIHLSNHRQDSWCNVSRSAPSIHSKTSLSQLNDQTIFADRDIYSKDFNLLDKASREHDHHFHDTSSLPSILGHDRSDDDLEMLDGLPIRRTALPHHQPTTNQVPLNLGKQQRPIASTNNTVATVMDSPTRSINAQYLIDVAFRMTFSQKAGKLAHGIKNIGSNFPVRLSDIAPGLFSPGHLSVSVLF